MKALDELSSASMRYLIDRMVGEKWVAKPDEIIVVSSDRPMASSLAVKPIAVKHVNLFDTTETGRLGPYVLNNIPNPKEPGYYRNLHNQFESAQHYGFKLCVLDNIDCGFFEQFDVKRSIDLALTYKIGVILKNVGKIQYDVTPLLEHYNVFGLIVDDGVDPLTMDKLRKSVKRPLMPVWFIGYDNLDNLNKTAETIKANNLVHMSVTYSLSGTYSDSVDVLTPLVYTGAK